MNAYVQVKVLADDEAVLPVYASAGAAGADLKAAISEEKVLLPGESLLIPTGLKMEIPEGYEVQIRPRSGLALKSQITVLNTPGTIDADYRGSVGVILINHGKSPFVITPYMRIAQAVLVKVEKALFIMDEMLQSTARGEGGFGHSGTH